MSDCIGIWTGDKKVWDLDGCSEEETKGAAMDGENGEA